MAQGLEVRVPYCDHRLVEYAFNAPWSLKSFDGREKSLLRAAGAGLAPRHGPAPPQEPLPGHPPPRLQPRLAGPGPRRAPATTGSARWPTRCASSPVSTSRPSSSRGACGSRLERVVDLALWLDHHRPELAL